MQTETSTILPIAGKEVNTMGFDFETLLGAEGNAIQSAYDDVVERAGGYRPSCSDNYTFTDYLMGRLPLEYYGYDDDEDDDEEDEDNISLECTGDCLNCAACAFFEGNCLWCRRCRCCEFVREEDCNHCKDCSKNWEEESGDNDDTAETAPADDSARSADTDCDLLDPDLEFEVWGDEGREEISCASEETRDAEAEPSAKAPVSGPGDGAGSSCSCEWEEEWFEQ